MNQDDLDPINALNMPEMADMTFATDLLIRVKEQVRNTAIALTETATPEARSMLRGQLRHSVAMHRSVTELMIRKRWFHPYEMAEQYQLDQLAAKNTSLIGKMDLYRGDTSRKGMFDRTPDESAVETDDSGQTTGTGGRST